MRAIANDCVMINDYIYFVTDRYGILVEANIKTNKKKILGILPISDTRRIDIECYSIIYCNNKLYISIIGIDELLSFDLKSNKWSGIKLHGLMEKPAVFAGFSCDNKIYLVGGASKGMVVYDTETYEIEYLYEFYEGFEKRQAQNNDVFFRSHYVLINDRVYFASCRDNYVVEIDLKSHKYQWYQVGKENNRYSGIAYDGEKFWLSPRNGDFVVSWKKDNDAEEIAVPIKNHCEYNSFFGAIYNQHYVLIPNQTNSCSIKIDTVTNKIYIVDKIIHLCKYIDNNTMVIQYSDGLMTFVSGENTTFMNIELSIEEIKDACFKFGYDCKEFWENDSIYFENNMINLSTFLDIISI